MTFRTPFTTVFLAAFIVAGIWADGAHAAPWTAASSKVTRSVERGVVVYRGAKQAQPDEGLLAGARATVSAAPVIVRVNCNRRRYLRTHGFTSGLRIHHRGHGGFPGDQFGVF